MVKRVRSGRGQSSERQRAQRDLMDRAQKIPGVAEVIAAYGRLQPYVHSPTGVTAPPMRYATGGNQ